MSIHNLEGLFKPESVAVIGASNRAGSVGSVVMRNLLMGGFGGPVMPVNPKWQAVHGVLVYPSIGDLPIAPDLAVICTPARTVPDIIDELGQRGTRAAAVLSAGLDLEQDDDGTDYEEKVRKIARGYGLRILGPNCIGVIVPGIGLNASFAHAAAIPGRIAFLAQSGGLTTAVLDYAKSYGIGFSHFLSLGNIVDVDFGDVLDYLGTDPEVTAILLYMEAIKEAREFMSAARSAARNKPVLVVKAGRVAEGARAAMSHTGALAGSDDVYQAAFQRAGMLRVVELDELFDAVQTLASSKPLKGDRLAVLTNGGGPGVMAVDALISQGGRLADIEPATIAKLDEVLPGTWSRANPVDMIGDAPGKLYAESMRLTLADPNVDALLVMHVPTAMASSTEAAEAVVEVAKETNKTVLTSWLGRDGVAEARRVLADAAIPTFTSPDRAVRGFQHLVRYRRNQELLMETPPSVPEQFTPATATARLVIQNAMAAGRDVLSEAEAKAVLAAYGIPIVETQIAATPEDCVRIAREIGFPVALKILSPDISHKSDVGGVALNLDNEEDVERAARAMLTRIVDQMPDAKLTGFTVQQMARRPGAQELLIGVVDDAIFGPVVMFGQGGKAVEVIGDHAVALPPLNMGLAQDLIEQTRVYKLLKGYRDEPPADLDAICLTLIKVSTMITDLAELAELDINPLLADQNGVLALDARLRVGPSAIEGAARLAIRPYPKELEESLTLKDGRKVLLRPIRPEDEPAHHKFVGALSPEDSRYRFFGLVRQIPHSQMARLTQIDYDREMAFVATAPDEHGEPETLGVVRVVNDPDNQQAEFAIVVRSDSKRLGLGSALLKKMVRYCRTRRTPEMVGQILPDNQAMISLAKQLGFEIDRSKGGDILDVRLKLG